MKKKIYKRWWFWLIVVFVVIGAALQKGNKIDDTSVATDLKQEDTKKEPDKQEEKKEKKQKETKKEEKKDDSIKAGSYKIGQDLAAGEYAIVTSGIGYIEVTKDSKGTLDSIIMNDNIQGHAIVTVGEGQYLNFRDAKAYPIDKIDLKPKDGVYKDGTYKVGVHIPAGEYKVSPQGSGYIEVAKDSKGTLESIITNDNIDADKYITVQDGQYLKLTNATITVK